METHDMSGDPSDGDHLSPSSSDGAGSRTGSVTTSSAPSDDHLKPQLYRTRAASRWTRELEAELVRVALAAIKSPSSLDQTSRNWEAVGAALSPPRSAGAAHAKFKSLSDGQKWAAGLPAMAKKPKSSSRSKSSSPAPSASPRQTAAPSISSSSTVPASVSVGIPQQLDTPFWDLDDDVKLMTSVLLRGEQDWTSIVLDFQPSPRTVDDLKRRWFTHLRQNYLHVMSFVETTDWTAPPASMQAVMTRFRPSPHPRLLGATSLAHDTIGGQFPSDSPMLLQPPPPTPTFSHSMTHFSNPEPPAYVSPPPRQPFSASPPPAYATASEPSHASTMSPYNSSGAYDPTAPQIESASFNPPVFSGSPPLSHVRSLSHQPDKPSPLSRSTTMTDLDQQQQQQQESIDEQGVGTGEHYSAQGWVATDATQHQHQQQPSWTAQYSEQHQAQMGGDFNPTFLPPPAPRHVHFQPEPSELRFAPPTTAPSATVAAPVATNPIDPLTTANAMLNKRRSGRRDPSPTAASTASDASSSNSSNSPRPRSSRAASRKAEELMHKLAKESQEQDSDDDDRDDGASSDEEVPEMRRGKRAKVERDGAGGGGGG